MSFKKLLIVVSVAVAAASCSKSPTAPSPFTQTQTGTVSVFGTNSHALTIPQNGTLTLTLTWTSASVDLNLFLAPTTCTQLYPMAQCGILAQSTAGIGTTTEIITRAVTNGQTFTVFVDSLSQTSTQSYSLTATIQ